MSTSNQHDNSGPPTKRTRSDLESPLTEIRKHESLYFENGNVVLLSLPEDGIVTAFKLYKDVLVLHSSVFERMLSIPSPPNPEEYDGVPLVHLQDRAGHLFPFLKAIYEPMGLPMKGDFYPPFDIAEITFMLAKKYQCDKLLKCMRKTLSDIWPKDLTAWDNCQDYKRMMMTVLWTYLSTLPEPCSAIRLAREYDVPSILPAAFYHLHCLSSQVFGRGRTPRGNHMGVAFDPTPKLMHLSTDDFACFVQGNFKLQRFWKQKAKDLPASIRQSCRGRRCVERLRREVDLVRNRHDHLYFDELSLLEIQRQSIRARGNLCEECCGGYIRLLAERRTEIWNSLPEFFGLKTDAGL